ncbi:MAG: hypothetical protein ACW98X_21135 [Promethearchaeota archaeon]
MVGIIFLSCGIYLMYCCSSTSLVDGDIWYYLVKYAGLHYILLGIGGVLTGISFLVGIFLGAKPRRKQ